MADLPFGLTRRRFLAAAVGTAGAVALGACGGGDDESDEPDQPDEDATGAGSGIDGDPMLVLYLPIAVYAADRPNRIPLGLADRQGLLAAEDSPDSIEVEVLGPDEEPFGDPITVPLHVEGLMRGYYPLELEAGEAGIYTLRTKVGDSPASEANFAVNTIDELQLIKPGDPMPALASPTTADAMGVEPICTADPVCPLHDVTVADALAAGGPLAIVVATPAYCSTAMCGPVHQIFVDALAGHPEVKGLHLEVYRAGATDRKTLSPPVNELLLPFEPTLILVGSDGVVQRRLDAIYDTAEVDSALSALS